MAICDNTIQEWQFIKHPFRVNLCHRILSLCVAHITKHLNVLKMIACTYLIWRIKLIDFKYSHFFTHFTLITVFLYTVILNLI